MITRETAMDIALAYREVETAEKLLSGIAATMEAGGFPDTRDAFGRLSAGLQLGVPSGDTSQRLFHVPWSLAKPIIQAHIATHKSKIAALSVKAQAEMEKARLP